MKFWHVFIYIYIFIPKKLVTHTNLEHWLINLLQEKKKNAKHFRINSRGYLLFSLLNSRKRKNNMVHIVFIQFYIKKKESSSPKRAQNTNLTSGNQWNFDKLFVILHILIYVNKSTIKIALNCQNNLIDTT